MQKLFDRLTKFHHCQSGLALPIVLAMLLVGSVAVPPILSAAATGVNSTRVISKGVSGLYAAEAGVENALWHIRNGQTPPLQLDETVNGTNVGIQTLNRGTFTIYFGELVPAGEHNDWLSVASTVTWDSGAGAYRYDVTINWLPVPGTPEIKIKEVGIRFPLGYTYQAGSAALFAGNLSTEEPQIVQDAAGADMLKWTFGTPHPSLDKQNPVMYQSVYMTGAGDIDGHYAWVVAVRSDVGVVGEIVGALHIITATATRPTDGQVTGKVIADVLEAEKTYILAWKIFK